MDLRSPGKKLSFDILTASDGHDGEEILFRSNSDPYREKIAAEGIALSHDRRQRRKRKNRASKKKKKMNDFLMLEDPINEAGTDIVLDIKDQMCFDKSYSAISLDSNCHTYCVQTVTCEERTAVEERETVGMVLQVAETESRNLYGVGELRQRNINGGVVGDGEESKIGGDDDVERSVERSSSSNDSKGVECRKLETAESLDWKQLMEDYSSNILFVEKSPLKYFMEEMYAGNSLRSTTNLGDEKERERVYDTLFRMPWRCELLIDVGFLLCLDSFLSLLTIMPTRIMMAVWRLANKRQIRRPSAAELCDFGCFIVLAFGVTILEQTDISLIYHMIRGQGTIKLYVVYNVLEIFDKLFQNLCGDVMQTLFNSAEGFASCPYESMWFWLWRLVSDQALSVLALILHSFTLLAQAITLSTCIVAHNNALLALLVSTNFAEIKSSVFKRFNKENIQSLVYFDSVERFHICASLLFVLSQNILEAEGPWFQSYCLNALLVFISEMAIDIIKHSFLAKFNNIKPITYSEFLEDLCKQTLNIETEDGKRNLTFVPLAPACVVIRALSPIYSANVPCDGVAWRVVWMLMLCGVTFVMLSSLKVLVGMILRKHAIWYIQRCQIRRHHLHYD